MNIHNNIISNDLYQVMLFNYNFQFNNNFKTL